MFDSISNEQIHLTAKSRNRKIGRIPASTSSAETCPPNCPLKDAGCYADGGPMALHWKKVTTGERGVPFLDFCQSITELKTGTLWRHNVAGDLAPLPNDKSTIDGFKLAQLASANIGRCGFTYTHFDVVDNLANRSAVYSANDCGFTVNLSANNLHHADLLIDTECGPVVTVLGAGYQRSSVETLKEYKGRLSALPSSTPSGHQISVCPATYKSINCASCKLCQRQNRKTVVGFPVHGFRKMAAGRIAVQAPQ